MEKRTLLKPLGIVRALLVLWAIGMPSSQAHAQDLKKLAADLAMQVHALGHTRVTVVDFRDLDDKPSKLGKLLAQDLQEALADPKLKLQVVDQGHLSELFEQIEKAEEGLLDPDTSRALGKIAGTEVMIVGTVMPSSVTIKLQVKAIDLETAKLVKAQSASLARVGLRGALATESEGGDEDDEAADDARQAAAEKSAKAKQPPPPVRTIRDQGVVFELDECSMSGHSLTCDLTVTSEGRDRKVAVYFDSRAWSDTGDEHGPDEIMVANSSSDDQCAVKQILRGVPTPLSLTFPNFGTDSSLVERLRVYWQEREWCYRGARPVDFDKIALAEGGGYSSKKAGHGGGGESGGGGGKGKGGLLQRFGNTLVNRLEEAATQMLDKETDKLVGDDEEEEDGETKPKKKKKG